MTTTMEPAKNTALCRWKVSNLLVAGRRVSGETMAATPELAVRNVAARNARDLKVDVAAAICRAANDPYKHVEALPDWQGPRRDEGAS